MQLKQVIKVIEKYVNKAFILYQNEYKLEVCFSNWCSIYFEWSENEDITKVIIESKSGGDYEGFTNECFEYALKFIEANSEIIMKYNKLQ